MQQSDGRAAGGCRAGRDQHRRTGDGSGHRPRLHGACGPRFQRATGAPGRTGGRARRRAPCWRISRRSGRASGWRSACSWSFGPPRRCSRCSALPLSRPQRAFIAWFGVRGVGSIYYLAYALSHGVPAPAGRMLADITLVVVAGSIVLHGISVTPLMQRYSAFIGERRRQ